MRTSQARLLLCILALSVSAPAAAAQGASFTQESQFRPVRLTYVDLTAIVQRVRAFLARANGDSVDAFLDGLSVSDGTRTVSASGATIDSLRARSPRVSNSARYSYMSRSGAINEVTITLSDYSRVVRVAGTSPEQVDALSALLREELGKHTSMIGGPVLRISAGLGLLGGSLFLFSLATGRRLRFAFVALVAVQGAVYLLPWSKWLPGTGVYAESASFVVRYSAELGAIGLVLAVVSLAVPLLSAKASTAPPRKRR